VDAIKDIKLLFNNVRKLLDNDLFRAKLETTHSISWRDRCMTNLIRSGRLSWLISGGMRRKSSLSPQK
jgi:hypothetical protein